MTEGSANPRQLASMIFILVIALVFTLQFGPGSRGCEAQRRHPESEQAALVNGREIAVRDFQRQYSAQLNFMRMQMQGSPISEALARQIGIPKQVMDRLVDDELLAQAAEKHGIDASDAEVLSALERNPDFQKEGDFDPETYTQMVRDYYRKTPHEYEGEIRRRLAAAKLQDIVEGTAVVSDEEIKTRYEKSGNKAQVTFVRFMPSMFSQKVQLKPDEVAAYAKDHQKELADYYDKNKFLYHQSEQVHARHILVKVDRDADQAKKDEAKKKAEDLRKQLVDDKKDFAELAKANSDDPGSKDKGGDLGFNEASAWVPEFSEAAFKLKAGEISPVVQTPFGFHIIKVEEKKPPQNKELKDVENEIARTLLSKEKAKTLAKTAAEAALAQAKTGKKLMDLFPAKAEGASQNPFETPTDPEATDSGEFDSTQLSVPKLGGAPELATDAIKANEPKLLDRIYSVNDGFVVAEVSNRIQPSEEKFAADKDRLRDEALRGKQIELRESYLKALRKQAQVTTNDKLINGDGSKAPLDEG